MLRAMVHRKTQRLHTEDILTAMAFSRLEYLAAPRGWSLLLSAMADFPGQSTTAREVIADLRHAATSAAFEASFWPWLETGEGARVQPDVVARLGPFEVIFEAKRLGGGEAQSREQLARELDAVRREAGPERSFVLVMVEPPATSFAEWSRALGVHVLGFRWVDLRDAVDAALARGDSPPHERAILTDLAAGLDLAGVHGVAPLATLHVSGVLRSVPPGFGLLPSAPEVSS
jgi:hypothetical protein